MTFFSGLMLGVIVGFLIGFMTVGKIYDDAMRNVVIGILEETNEKEGE
ncbi:hypothetical protein [Oceanobacillus sojae]|nr:hypothetical protein [Oceanobacillus sojae]